MINMDVKGITWVGNIYRKFEDMCLEAEDIIYEDTVKYIENQMQAVGTSVKKLYSDVMQDLLPPSSDEKAASELLKDQYTDAGFCKKPFRGFKERHVKTDTKKTTADSSIDNDAMYGAYVVTSQSDPSLMSASRNSVRGRKLISRSRKYVGSTYVKSNLGVDEILANKKLNATKIVKETTSAETGTCRTSESCKPSNENQNQNHAVSVSKPASDDVTRSGSVAECCNEIESASTEQCPRDPELDKSSEEKQMNMSSFSGVLSGEPDDSSMHRTIQSDDCSHSMVFLSHPDQDLETMQQDHLKIEENCIMVTKDELQLAPMAGGNPKTNKKKRLKDFSISKNSARKQEYEDLAKWHGNSEKVKGECMENSVPTSIEDQKKLLLPSMSEPEWELL